MTVARQWVRGVLSQDAAVGDLVPAERIFANQSLMTAQTPRPCIVIKIGTDSDEQLFDDWDIQARPHRQFLEVWVHDARSSYVLIDQVCLAVKAALRTEQVSADAAIMSVRYLETSQDMNDTTLDTVLRYMRFQLVMSQ